jgi:chromosome segregation ATPase
MLDIIMAIQESDIFRAADSLAREGINPTCEKVRIFLGNRGSYSVIAPALKKWREAQKAGTQASVTDPIPDSLEQRFAALRMELWSKAVDNANARLEAERTQLREERAQSEASCTDLAQLADSKTKELEEATMALDAANAEAKVMTARLNQVLAQSQQLATRAQVAEAKYEELLRRLDDQNVHLKRLAAENADLIARIPAKLEFQGEPA